MNFWVMTSKPTLVRQHWLKWMQGPRVLMSSSDGVRMTSNSSSVLVPSKAVMWIPASLDPLPLLRLQFFFYIFNLNWVSCNRSFTVKFNGDDVTGKEPCKTILQLATLTLCSSFIKNGHYVLAILHYLCTWFTCPASTIIMKFEADILIKDPKFKNTEKYFRHSNEKESNWSYWGLGIKNFRLFRVKWISSIVWLILR